MMGRQPCIIAQGGTQPDTLKRPVIGTSGRRPGGVALAAAWCAGGVCSSAMFWSPTADAADDVSLMQGHRTCHRAALKTTAIRSPCGSSGTTRHVTSTHRADCDLRPVDQHVTVRML